MILGGLQKGNQFTRSAVIAPEPVCEFFFFFSRGSSPLYIPVRYLQIGGFKSSSRSEVESGLFIHDPDDLGLPDPEDTFDLVQFLDDPWCSANSTLPGDHAHKFGAAFDDIAE